MLKKSYFFWITTLKKHGRAILRWGLALCCVVYIGTFFFRNTDELRFVFSLRPLTIASLTAALFVQLLLHCYRFQIALEKCSGTKISSWDWFKIVVLGRFLGTFAPQAGNIYRSVCLKKRYQLSYTRYASSLFSITWLDACLDLTFASVIIWLVKPGLKLGHFKAVNFLLFLLLLAGSTPILLEFAFRMTKFRGRHLSWVHSKLSEMLTVSVNNLVDWVYILKMALTNMLGFINMTAALYFCFLSLDTQIALPISALFYVILRMSNYIVITPGNIGVREVACGILSEQVQHGMGQGIVIAAVIRILETCIIIVLGTLFGGIELLRHRKDYSELEE